MAKTCRQRGKRSTTLMDAWLCSRIKWSWIGLGILARILQQEGGVGWGGDSQWSVENKMTLAHLGIVLSWPSPGVCLVIIMTNTEFEMSKTWPWYTEFVIMENVEYAKEFPSFLKSWNTLKSFRPFWKVSSGMTQLYHYHFSPVLILGFCWQMLGAPVLQPPTPLAT